jgi:histone-lysine N-methyltransferase SETMAR
VKTRLTIREITEEFNISYGTCQSILTEDLQTRCVSAKFVPHLLTEEQKEHHMAVATNLLQEAESDPHFMEGIITGDETWVFGYDPETKRQSSQWKSPSKPRPKKAR